MVKKSGKDGSTGRGVMPYKWTGTSKKDTYGGQRPPITNPTQGRTLVDDKGREGMKEK